MSTTSSRLSEEVWDACDGHAVQDVLVALSSIMTVVAGNAGITHEQLIAFLIGGITESAEEMAALTVRAAGPLQ